MVQADWLGAKVGGHLVRWAAFISPCPCNDDTTRYCQSYYYYYYYYYYYSFNWPSLPEGSHLVCGCSVSRFNSACWTHCRL